MMRGMRWAFVGTALSVLPIAACSTADKAATEVQSAAQAQVNPTLSTTDANFINQAAAGGLGEVEIGKLAARKGGSPAVRRFGQQMVTDHTPVNQQLTQLAQAKQLSPSTTLDAPRQQTFNTLNGLRGRAFDRQYIQGQLADHQDQLTLFQTEAQSGTDPDVKAFAARNAGMIQQHVAELQRMNAAGTSTAKRHRAHPQTQS